MENFNEEVYREIAYNGSALKGNVIFSDDIQVIGTSKITIEEESHEGVRIFARNQIGFVRDSRRRIAAFAYH